MKEQCKSEKDAAILEEGLQQEKQEYINKLKYNTNCCKQWIRYIRLIFLFELTLFFGWGCYMILQSYHSRVTENEVTVITREKYPSVSEVQKSHPTTEMSVLFKTEDITNKLNNFLGAIKLTNNKEQGKTSAINVNSIMQTSTQNSINMLSNDEDMVKSSDINNSPMTLLSEDLVYDEEFMKNLMQSKIFPIKYVDKIITINRNKNSIDFKQFLEKLQNIAKLIGISDLGISNLEQIENKYGFIKDTNHLTLNNQKNHALDTSNKIESLRLDATTTLNKDSDFKINLESNVQSPEQKLSDLIKNVAQDDHGEKKSLRDWTNERVNAFSESDFVICPPCKSYESSGISSEEPIKSSSTLQSVLAPEMLDALKNSLSVLSDDIKNNDNDDADDNNMSASSDRFASRSNEQWFDIPIIQNPQDYFSSEITANTKEEEEKYKLMKNIEPSFNFEFSQPKIQDGVESSTPNVKFQWFNAPPLFANDLQFGSKDVSESSNTQNPSLTVENTETINAFTPEKDEFYDQCQIKIKMNVFKVKCPGIMFNEELDLASSNIDTDDFSDVINFQDLSNIINFKNNFDRYIDDYDKDYYDIDYYDKDKSEQSKDELISNENFDKIVADLPNSVSKIINAMQESIQNETSLKDDETLFNFLFKNNSPDRIAVNKHDTIKNSDRGKIKQEIASSSTTISSFTHESHSGTVDFNKERNPLLKVFNTQQPKQLKVTKKQDFLNFENDEAFGDLNKEHIHALEEQVFSEFNNLQPNIMEQELPKISSKDNNVDIYSMSPSTFFPSSDLRREEHDLKDLEYRNPYDREFKFEVRKKRMADDLTISKEHEQVSNALEEVDTNVNLPKKLKRVFQKMETLAAFIDRLHEHHLLTNKLDDDYVSKEFLIKTEEGRKSYEKINL
ncbi:uncharacterized protein [Anoplolepis gracilipes]|uniref:uncharacterized protein n=1 Tax=Anoplolepis gracilipes TaxID=354296 RepID=UPI003BA1B124